MLDSNPGHFAAKFDDLPRGYDNSLALKKWLTDKNPSEVSLMNSVSVHWPPSPVFEVTNLMVPSSIGKRWYFFDCELV